MLSLSLETASKDSSRSTGSPEGELLLRASCLLKTGREPESRPPRGDCACPRQGAALGQVCAKFEKS